MNYCIVNADVSWHLISFLSLRELLVIVTLNSYFQQLIESTPFYQELSVLYKKGKTISVCYSKGLLHLLEKLKYSNEPIHCSRSYVLAARKNKVNVLRWCFNEGMEIKHLNVAILVAARKGYIEVLQWFTLHVLHSSTSQKQFTLKPYSYYKSVISSLIVNDNDSLPILQWFVDAGFKFVVTPAEVNALIKMNRFNLLQWLSKVATIEYSIENVIWAASDGYVNMLQWMKASNNTLQYPCEVMNAAIENNQVIVLDWLFKERRISYTRDSLKIAVKRGHLETCQWFINQSINICRCFVTMTKAAILYDRINILQLLHQSGLHFHYSTDVIYRAATLGNFQTLHWLKTMGCTPEMTFEAIRGSVIGGYLEILQLFDSFTLSSKHLKKLIKIAVYHNKLTVLIYLKAHYQIKCTKKLGRIAARNGHVQILDWLNIECAPLKYNTKTIDAAAKYGQLAVLEWFRSKNYACHCTPYTIDRVASNGHVAVLEWFRSNTPDFIYSENAIDEAAKWAHIGVLQWFQSSGYPFLYSSRAVDEAARLKNLDVLQWFHDSGYPFLYSSDAFNGAATHFHLPILEWFQSNGYPIHFCAQNLIELHRYPFIGKPIIKWFKEAGFDTTYKQADPID